MGRTARGVRGVRFKGADDSAIDMVVVDTNASLLTLCEGGYGKRTSFDEYRIQSRGGSGVRNIKTPPRNGPVVAMRAVEEDQDLMLISERGMIVRTETRQVSVIGRDTQGVRIMRLKEGDRLVACTLLAQEPEVADAEPDAPSSSTETNADGEAESRPTEPEVDPPADQ